MVGFDKMTNSDLNIEVKDELFQLMAEKGKLETEIKGFLDVLSSNNIGMHEPLVDHEGFPRNDIDVYQVRTARHKIICLQNDHKNVMERITSGLHHLHASSANSVCKEDYTSAEQPMPEPFAQITLVTPGSPADLSGLQVNDLVLEFGSVNKQNFKSMQEVAVVVRSSAGQSVRVMVKRPGRHSPLHLDLLPRPWSGTGLIGCKIDPLPLDFVER